MMIKVAFLGSRPLGSAAVSILKAIDSVEIVGYVVRSPSVKAWWKEDPFYGSNPRVTHEQLHELDFDLGVSINYWKIIEPELIAKPSLGFINLHHSYNLSLRGRDMTTHAILQARESGRWYHGSTLHYTDDGLDTGPVIASASCPITEQDTAWTLFQKTEAVGIDLLEVWLPRLVAGRPPVAFPEPELPLHLRKPDEDVREISDVFADPVRAYDVVRAYDFDGHYPYASMMDGETRIPLTTRASAGQEMLIDVGQGRAIYRVA